MTGKLRKEKWFSILLLVALLFSLAMPAAGAVEGEYLYLAGNGDLTFTAIEGQALDTWVEIGNNASGFNWSATTSADWIKFYDVYSGTYVSYLTGYLDDNLTDTIELRIDTSGLAADNYSGSVTITNNDISNNSVTVDLSLNTTPAYNSPNLEVAWDSVDFSAVLGNPQVFTPQVAISNTGSGELWWTATTSDSWISIGSELETEVTGNIYSSGSSVIQLNLDSTGLDVGEHEGQVTISNQNETNNVVNIWINLTIEEPQVVNPANLVVSMPPPEDTLEIIFDSTVGQDEVFTRDVNIANTGDEELAWTATATSDPSWVRVNSGPTATGTVAPGGAGSIQLQIDTTGLETGTYYGEVTISNDNKLDNHDTLYLTLNMESASVTAVGASEFDPAEHGGVATPHILFRGTIKASEANLSEPVGIASIGNEYYAYNNLGNGQATAVEAVGFSSLDGVDLSRLTLSVDGLLLNEDQTYGQGDLSDRQFIEVWENGNAAVNLDGTPVLTSADLVEHSNSQITEDGEFVNRFNDFYGEGTLNGDVNSELYQEFTQLFGPNYQFKVMTAIHPEPIPIEISANDPPMTEEGVLTWTFHYTLMLTGEPVELLDTEAPATPQGLVAESVWREPQIPDYGHVYLEWGAASDNVGVDHYNVYLKENGVLTPVNEAWGTSYIDSLQGTGEPGIRVYQVTAVDAAGNESEPSAELHVTTFMQENMVQDETHNGYDLAGDIMAWTTMDPDTQQWYINIRRLSDWTEEQVAVAMNSSDQEVSFVAWFNPNDGDGGVIWAEDHAIKLYRLGQPDTVEHPNPVTILEVPGTELLSNLAVDMPRLVYNKQVENAELWLYDLEQDVQIKLADNLPIPGAAFSGPNIAYKAPYWSADGMQYSYRIFNTGDPGDSGDDTFINLTAGFDGQVYDLDLNGTRVVWSGELDSNRDLYLYDLNDPLDNDHIQKIGVSFYNDETDSYLEYQDFRPSLGQHLLAWESSNGSDSGVWLYFLDSDEMTPLQETRQSTSNDDLTVWRPVLNQGRILYSGAAVNDPYYNGTNGTNNYLWLASLPQVATTVRVEPEYQESTPGSIFPVEIKVDNAQDMYAADLQLYYDPTVVQVEMIDPDGTGNLKPHVWINSDDQDPNNGEEPFGSGSGQGAIIQLDTTTDGLQNGLIQIAATRYATTYPENRSGYGGYYGNAPLATVYFRAVSPGYSNLDLEVELRGNSGETDSNVYLIPAEVIGGEVEVLQQAGNSISGWVRLEGTPDPGPEDWNDNKAGARVQLVSYEPAGSIPQVNQTVYTDEYGIFSFDGIADGAYDLLVSRSGYLSREITGIVVSNNQPLNLGKILLYTGDLSRNNWVDLGDLRLMREAYRTWAGMANYNWMADLDWDDNIGLIDLVLMARNFAREGAGGPFVHQPSIAYDSISGQVTITGTPLGEIYYTIGTAAAPPADPDTHNPDQLYIKGTGITMTEGQVIKAVTSESYWNGVSEVVIKSYADIMGNSF